MEEDSLAHTLKEIVTRTIPSPRYARYFEQHLQIYLSRMGNYPPRYLSPTLPPDMQGFTPYPELPPSTFVMSQWACRCGVWCIFFGGTR